MSSIQVVSIRLVPWLPDRSHGGWQVINTWKKKKTYHPHISLLVVVYLLRNGAHLLSCQKAAVVPCITAWIENYYAVTPGTTAAFWHEGRCAPLWSKYTTACSDMCRWYVFFISRYSLVLHLTEATITVRMNWWHNGKLKPIDDTRKYSQWLGIVDQLLSWSQLQHVRWTLIHCLHSYSSDTSWFYNVAYSLSCYFISSGHCGVFFSYSKNERLPVS